jgi:hypothetical protein
VLEASDNDRAHHRGVEERRSARSASSTMAERKFVIRNDGQLGDRGRDVETWQEQASGGIARRPGSESSRRKAMTVE